MDQLIHKQFPTVIEFIDNAREENVNNKVFVHCQAGISRSATVCIAYLMTRENMTLKEAFLQIHKRMQKSDWAKLGVHGRANEV